MSKILSFKQSTRYIQRQPQAGQVKHAYTHENEEPETKQVLEAALTFWCL